MKRAYLLLTILALFLLIGCSEKQPVIEGKDDSIISVELTYSPAKVIKGQLENYGIQYKVTYSNRVVSYVDLKINDLPVLEQQKLDVLGDTVINYSYQGFDILLHFDNIELTDEITNHQHENVLVYSINPDCLHSGYKMYVCNCGTPTKETISATGHTLSDWAVVENATCETYGEKERHCQNDNCYYSETNVLAPLGHKNSDWIVDVEATCTVKGSSHVECTVCKQVLYRNNSGVKHVDVDKNNACDACEEAITLKPSIVSVGKDLVQFGTYPQKAVSDSVTYEALLALVGEKPTAENLNEWVSYNYYIASENDVQYMWYKDVVLNEVKYRAVYFTDYRPNWTINVSNVNSSFQDDNGYYASSVYFFEYLPITWRVLTKDNTKSLLLANIALDAQEFNSSFEITTVNGKAIYANNYEYSSIRSWLNDTFYNTAFNENDKTYIVEAYLENKEITKDNKEVKYSVNNTYDNVFLLSSKDIVKLEYGFKDDVTIEDANRQFKATDYARIQGCASKGTFNDNCQWALRTPDYSDDKSVSFVSVTGMLDHYRVYTTYRGIVPAVWVLA